MICTCNAVTGIDSRCPTHSVRCTHDCSETLPSGHYTECAAYIPLTFAGETAQIVVQLPGDKRVILRTAEELVSFLAHGEATKFQPRQITIRIEYVHEQSGQKSKEVSG